MGMRVTIADKNWKFKMSPIGQQNEQFVPDLITVEIHKNSQSKEFIISLRDKSERDLESIRSFKEFSSKFINQIKEEIGSS